MIAAAMRALAVLLLFAGPASAQGLPQWAGYWAQDPAWCARAGEGGTQTPYYFGARLIYGPDLNCLVAAVKPVKGDKTWRVDLNCTVSGGTRPRSVIFMLAEGDSLLRVMADGSMATLTRCGKPALPPVPGNKTACTAAGGTWGIRGLSTRPGCTMPTPDAGRVCKTSVDCAGVCLAGTNRCSPVSPMFGCMELVENSGEIVQICLD